MARVAMETIYLRKLLADIDGKLTHPSLLFCDNKGALDLVKNNVHHKRTKHIDRRHFFIRELVENHVVRVPYVSTDDNLADMFTKVLDRLPFEKFRRLVMNVLVSGVQYLAPRGKQPRSER